MWTPEARATVLRRSIAVFFLCGILISWKLWAPSPIRTFPIAPVVPGFTLDTRIDLLLVASLCALLLALIVQYTKKSVEIGALITVVAVLCLSDINRLQPWVYQYTLMFGAFLFVSRKRTEGGALHLCGLLIAFLYIWSGIQKLNPGFIDSMYHWLIAPFPFSENAFIRTLGTETAILEIALGIGLLIEPVRRFAVLALISMHLLILYSIGPLGHNWNHVVWPWNIAQIVFLVVLFWPSHISGLALLRMRGIYHHCIVLLFAVLPVLSLVGYWDSYLSFSLYSGNIDIAQFHITPRQEEIREQYPNFRPNIIYWSLDALGVPAYPETRVYRKIFAKMCTTVRDPEGMTMTVEPKRTLRGSREKIVVKCERIMNGEL